MNAYEGMFIFPVDMVGEDLEEALTSVRLEIEKLGGEVDAMTRLGKRNFARYMDKKEAGQYAVVTFHLAGDQVGPLRARLKLNEKVFRVQIVRAPEVAAAPAIPEGDEADGDA